MKFEIKNEPVRGDVEGLKINQLDKPLSDALIGIFSADETEFSEKMPFVKYSIIVCSNR
ncbi:MAG: hypothetical protein IJA12_06490 [Oscillospiraceae bacterium]|nr:hypothetical protein [Oscillospiraceae bacterium]